MLNGVPQGSVLGPLLFLLYVNDIDDTVTSKICKFADDPKIFTEVSSELTTTRVQSDINSLLKWSGKWEMQFNTRKCKVMHFGSTNKHFNYTMNGVVLDKVDAEKDLGVTVSSTLKSCNHIDEVVLKANRVLGLIYRTIENKTPDIVVPLYVALVRPLLEYGIQAWRPFYSKDIVKLEGVQRRAIRMIQGLTASNYYGKLKELNLFSLEKRYLRGDLIETFKIIKNIDKVDRNIFFELVNPNRSTRGHSLKIQKHFSRTDIRKSFFSNRVVSSWNGLPNSVVECKRLDSFKHNLDVYFREINIS